MNTPKVIKLNEKNQCMSVSCDFYQTCFYNSFSHTYTTIRKFYPHVVDGNKCYSVNSGKRSELKDNNYPYVFESIKDTSYVKNQS